MPLTEVNLNDIINGMESEQTTLRYSLGEGLKGRKDSVSVRRYIAHMKSEGSFGDADLWEAMAKATGRDLAPSADAADEGVRLEVVRRAKGVNDTAAGSIRFRGGMC